jgi:hypothetical protein
MGVLSEAPNNFRVEGEGDIQDYHASIEDFRPQRQVVHSIE